MLKEAIRGAGLRQNALAAACGISSAAVSHWVRLDSVPAKHLPRVARLLGVEPETLRPDLYQEPAPPERAT